MIRFYEYKVVKFAPALLSFLAVLAVIAILGGILIFSFPSVAAFGRATTPFISAVFCAAFLLFSLFSCIGIGLLVHEESTDRIEVFLAKKADARATRIQKQRIAKAATVLFLRSFQMVRGSNFEQQLYVRLKKAFSTATILRIGTRSDYVAFDFPNIETDDSNWEEVAKETMEKSIRIFCIPGSTEGIQWELNQCFDRYLTKTTFICPASVILDINDEWCETGEFVRRRYGLEWPEPTEEGYIFRYRDGRIQYGSWDYLDWLPSIK